MGGQQYQESSNGHANNMSTQENNQPTNNVEKNAGSERNNGSTSVSESSSFRCTVHSCLTSNGNIKFVDSIPTDALQEVLATRNDNTCSSNATICIRDYGSTTKNSGGTGGDAENSNPCASPNKCVPPRESLQPCPDGYEYVANNHMIENGKTVSLPSCVQKTQTIAAFEQSNNGPAIVRLGTEQSHSSIGPVKSGIKQGMNNIGDTYRKPTFATCDDSIVCEEHEDTVYIYGDRFEELCGFWDISCQVDSYNRLGGWGSGPFYNLDRLSKTL